MVVVGNGELSWNCPNWDRVSELHCCRIKAYDGTKVCSKGGQDFISQRIIRKVVIGDADLGNEAGRLVIRDCGQQRGWVVRRVKLKVVRRN